MDRYDRTIHDVQRKTDEKIMHWKMVRSDRHSNILVNARRVIRLFEADYSVGPNKYLLLFVERKTDFRDELGDLNEGYGFELFVLDSDGQIMVSLYDGVVERDDLLKLSWLIDAYNDRTPEFLAAFDESGAT